MRLGLCSVLLVLFGALIPAHGYTLEEAISLARRQNPDVAIAEKKVQAARGGMVEARAGYLPAVVSSGLYRKRERQGDTRLRPEDYSANVRVVEPLYTGGATSGRVAIARWNLIKAEAELAAVIDRVTLEVRLAFSELLLNRERIQVRQESVNVLRQELKSQRERLSAGTVGQLNVSRAEVSLAGEEPELFQAQTDLQNSFLRLGELLGMAPRESGEVAFPIAGTLRYEPHRPDLNDCLARAQANRPELRAAEADIAIQQQQLRVDRSATRPQVEVFSGYEVYNERDPTLGREFNHGYVVGLNASWALFDGFATRGRMQATRARQESALRALQALRLTINSEVRSAFLDLEQADHILASEAKNVHTAEESLQLARGDLSTGLGTQLDVLQAASSLSSTRSTRLSAIYLHNAALARLDRACGKALPPAGQEHSAADGVDLHALTRPPASLGENR